jgi:archaemetzincin
MKSRRTFFLLIVSVVAIFYSGCVDVENEFRAIKNPDTRKEEKEKPVVVDTITIIIQPYMDMDAQWKHVQYVRDELKKIYPKVRLNKSHPLPSFAYYKPRHRYKADSLLKDLQPRYGNEVVIGLTSKDISTSKDQYPDWGVMGLGECPGKACVVSTFRLSKKETSLQLFKVAIHELGHTQGLPHCEVKTCFMRDAEGGNPTGEEKEFCPKCKKVLEAKGWKFN